MPGNDGILCRADSDSDAGDRPSEAQRRGPGLKDLCWVDWKELSLTGSGMFFGLASFLERQMVPN